MNRQKTANLLEKRFEIVLGQTSDLFKTFPTIQAATVGDQPVQQTQATLMGLLVSKITADQIKNSIRRQRLELLLQVVLLVRDTPSGSGAQCLL